MNSGSPNCKSCAVTAQPPCCNLFGFHAVSASSSSFFFFKLLLRSKQGLTRECPLDFVLEIRMVTQLFPRDLFSICGPEGKLFVSEMSQLRADLVSRVSVQKTWQHGHHNRVSKHQALKMFHWYTGKILNLHSLLFQVVSHRSIRKDYF